MKGKIAVFFLGSALVMLTFAGLFAAYLCFQIVAKIFGIFWAILGLIFFPFLLIVAPIYDLIFFGNWFAIVYVYSGLFLSNLFLKWIKKGQYPKL